MNWQNPLIGLLINPQAIEIEKRRRRSAFVTLFPEAGPFRRDL